MPGRLSRRPMIGQESLFDPTATSSDSAQFIFEQRHPEHDNAPIPAVVEPGPAVVVPEPDDERRSVYDEMGGGRSAVPMTREQAEAARGAGLWSPEIARALGVSLEVRHGGPWHEGGVTDQMAPSDQADQTESTGDREGAIADARRIAGESFAAGVRRRAGNNPVIEAALLQAGVDHRHAAKRP